MTLDDIENLVKVELANPQTTTIAITVISFIPILIIYPFIQKNYRSGLLIGAIKA